MFKHKIRNKKMPLIDSFKVDHTKMKAPFVRVAKIMKTNKNEAISVFDMRFCTPNKDKMNSYGMHTLEHLLAGFIRDHLEDKNTQVIDCSPMGCKTGFYMSVLGAPSAKKVSKSLKSALKDVISIKNKKSIPELNLYQCGSYKDHSLQKAKKICKKILKKNIYVLDNAKVNLSTKQLKKIAKKQKA
jgi:S-ribosylhomocysteine lyase